MGLRAVSSNSLTASMRTKFTNSAQDYMNYDDGVFDKKNKTSMPRLG